MILLFTVNYYYVSCKIVDRSHLTSVERSIDIHIKKLDDRIVQYLSVPPPNIDTNVQAVAQMNVLLFRSIIDYFNYLSGIGDLLLKDDKEAYRLLEEIGLEGPQLLKLKMNRKSWDSIAKLYDYHEGEIEEMINTVGSIKLMWNTMKKQLEWYLEKKNADKKEKKLRRQKLYEQKINKTSI